MSTIGDQIIEALEEVLADAKGSETGVRQHTVFVPQDESGTGKADGAPAVGDDEPIKRRA